MSQKSFSSVEEAFAAIAKFETNTKTSFAHLRVSKNFGGDHDLKSEKHKVFFEDRSSTPGIDFDGIPFILLGSKILECHRGKDRHVSKVSGKGGDHDFKKRKLQLQNSKKIGCTAKVTIREVVLFSSHKLESKTEWNMRCSSKALKESIQNDRVTGSKKYIVDFPKQEDHDANCISEVAGITLPVDARVIRFIQGAVGEGVRSVSEMERHVRHFVRKDLFHGEEPPPRPNRRFHPTKRDIANAMYRGLIKDRLSHIDQDNLKLEVEKWKQERPHDNFFFRPHANTTCNSDMSDVDEDRTEDDIKIKESGPSADKLLFVHQTKHQRALLLRYGNELCLLDATYRTTRYSLPLFLVGVKTNCGYIVVGSFVTHDETQASIEEALCILQRWNKSWKPAFFMTDFCQEEINAVETVFEDCRVYVCDFHREQAWTRWIRNKDHGVHAQQDDVLPRLRRVARASTRSDFDSAVLSLKESSVWKENAKLRNWFGKIWLPCSQRWVWAFRKERFLVNVNTNNGIERQNEVFKHTFLQKHRNKTISQMAKTLVEDYVPQQFDRYVEQNMRCLDAYRRYHKSVPPFLHNRPRDFVKAAMERFYLASDIRRDDIQTTDTDGTFNVKSQTSPGEVYKVYFGDEASHPRCSCYDWEHNYVPCKHMISVMLNVEGWPWEKLSLLYRESPFINIDSDVVKGTTQDTSTSCHSEDEDEDFSCTQEGLVECKNIQAIPVHLSQHKRSMAAQCRELLKQITSMTYLVHDVSVLGVLRDSLNKNKEEIENSLPKESGLVLEVPNIKQLPASRGPSQPTQTLPLPQNKRRHPFSGRVGETAEVMRKQFKCALPVSQTPATNATVALPQPHLDLPDVFVTGESKATVTKHKTRRLEGAERNRIQRNVMLEDQEINVAQQILHSQFPDTQGLEDTALGPARQFSVFRGEFVQILHDGDLHWICISNIGCEAGCVKYFDSLNTKGTLKPEVQKLIASVMFEKGPEIRVLIVPVHQQSNSVDCGVFSIAFATAILYGQDPSTMVFDEERMRSHLLECLDRQAFTVFPQRAQAVQTANPRVLAIELFCDCRMPWHDTEKDPLMAMAECECCNKWYHRGCANVPLDVFVKGLFWECQHCT